MHMNLSSFLMHMNVSSFLLNAHEHLVISIKCMNMNVS